MVVVVPVQECGFGEEGGGDAGAHEEDAWAGDGGCHFGWDFDLEVEGVMIAAIEVDKGPCRVSVTGPNLDIGREGREVDVAQLAWSRTSGLLKSREGMRRKVKRGSFSPWWGSMCHVMRPHSHMPRAVKEHSKW